MKDYAIKDYAWNSLIPLMFIFLVALFFATAEGLPNEQAGPYVIPKLFGGLLTLLSLYQLLQLFQRKLKKNPVLGNIKRLVSVIAIIIVYLIGINYLGYFVSSTLFIITLMYMLSYRRHFVIFTVAGCWLAFSYFVFYKLLFIQLPLGYFYERFLE